MAFALSLAMQIASPPPTLQRSQGFSLTLSQVLIYLSGMWPLSLTVCFGAGEQGRVGIRPALQPPGASAQKQLNIFFLIHDFTAAAARYHLALCVQGG